MRHMLGCGDERVSVANLDGAGRKEVLVLVEEHLDISMTNGTSHPVLDTV
jgi:hypothetical protein